MQSKIPTTKEDETIQSANTQMVRRAAAKRKSNTIKYDNLKSKKTYLTWKEHTELFGTIKKFTDRYVEKLIEEMEEWTQEKYETYDRDCSYAVEEFYLLRHVTQSEWNEWLNEYPALANATDRCRFLFGLARERGAARGELKEATIHKVQWHYNPLWRLSEERAHKLKKEENKEIAATVMRCLVEGSSEAKKNAVQQPDETTFHTLPQEGNAPTED